MMDPQYAPTQQYGSWAPTPGQVSNGPQQGFPGQMPQGQPPPHPSNQLSNQMASMTLSGGQQKPPSATTGIPGGGGGPPGKFGGYPQQRPSPGPSPSLYTNGPAPSSGNQMPPHGHRPPTQEHRAPPPSDRMPVHGGVPPQQGQMNPAPPHVGQAPSQGSPYPSHIGQSGPMPPQAHSQITQAPSHVGQAPPQSSQYPPRLGQGSPMPPQSGNSLPPQGSKVPPSGNSFSTQAGNFPPHSSQMPLQVNQMPPQGGNLHPQSNQLPPQGSGFHPQANQIQRPGFSPHTSQMPPQRSNFPPQNNQAPLQGGSPFPHPPGHIPAQGGSPFPPRVGQVPPQTGSPFPLQGNQLQPQGGSPFPPQANQLPPQGGSPFPPQGNQLPPQGGSPYAPQTGQMPPSGIGPYPSQMGHPPPRTGPMPPGPYGATPQQPYGGFQPPPQEGYLPQPAQQQPQAQPVYSPQQQQARRLDPDQMPSPIQVMMDDRRNRSGVFVTNQKGLVPPLVTTDFVTQDQGNASPRYLRSSIYNVPVTVEMMKQTAVPFGLVVSPLAQPAEGEFEPPVVDCGEMGPVRCVRCKAYMCPYMQFVDGGRRFHCLFCKATTEVPAEYFQHLDHTGQRVDRCERPELVLGTYEFVATKDYCRNNVFPKPPALIFVLDVSYNNIKSGLVQLLCSNMKSILRMLPRDLGAEKSHMRVGFITYNSTVHFYNVKGCLAQPQMMVVSDVQDMFVPLLDGFLCDPEESEAVVDSLMEQIPAMFADTRETETVLGPAIQAGLEALKASECAGKLLVFNSSLPIAEAPGKLKNRDDRKLLATDKEKSVLAPQITFYNNLGQECVGAGCSVDLFIFNNSYIDLATIGQIARLTGGEVFKYTYFQADLDGERLIADLKHDVSRPTVFDAIMRVRTSTGVRATDFSGHFFMSNTTDMELASIDCDKAVAIEVKHDDKLTEEDGVYVQVALLFTSVGGQRRLRVLNLALRTCSQLADLYRSCELDTIVNFFSKQVVSRLLESTPKAVKEGLVNRCAQMLACYRKNCASPSSAGQLILPECMKLLPLYVNCILKSDAVSGGSDMTVDDRSFAMQAVTIMDIPSSVVYFYPRLLPLHDIEVDSDELPPPIRCSSDKIRDDGVYILENGIHMFLWIGLNVGVEWVQNVFGVHSAAQIDIDRTTLQELDNPLSQRVRSVVETVRRQRHRSMRLTLVRQRDKLEMVFKHFLMEDRGLDGSASYVDFLCHMHREIRNLLS